MQTIEVHVVGNLCFWESFSLSQLVPTVNSFFTFNLCQLSTVSSRNFPVLVTPLAILSYCQQQTSSGTNNCSLPALQTCRP